MIFRPARAGKLRGRTTVQRDMLIRSDSVLRIKKKEHEEPHNMHMCETVNKVSKVSYMILRYIPDNSKLGIQHVPTSSNLPKPHHFPALPAPAPCATPKDRRHATAVTGHELCGSRYSRCSRSAASLSTPGGRFQPSPAKWGK